jgi:hypothetical protein
MKEIDSADRQEAGRQIKYKLPQILFFWPIRVSSTSQISMVCGSTPLSRPISLGRAGRFLRSSIAASA